MMCKQRLQYLALAFLTLLVGILSRKLDYVPLFIGDILYAILIYFGLRFLFINLKKEKTALFALLFCYSIESLQLYQEHWLLSIRNTTLGHYILGEGFLWSDLVCYLIGVFSSFILDYFVKIKTQNSSS